MKFFSQILTGDLILIKTSNATAQAGAIRARSAPAGDPLIVRIILWILATFGRPTVATVRAMRRTWPPITPETLPVLRIGIVFLLLLIGSLAASLAAKGG